MKDMALSWALKDMPDLKGREGGMEEEPFRRE